MKRAVPILIAAPVVYLFGGLALRMGFDIVLAIIWRVTGDDRWKP